MMPFVEEAPFVAQQLLPLLELPLPFVDPIHDGAELVLLADDVRLPFLELTEGLLAGLQLPSERVDPTPQRGLASLQLVLLQPQDVPVCVLHVHEALFELQDVLLLQEEFLDLPLEFVPLPDLERIRGGLEALDPTASATDQGVHLLEPSLPPFEHPGEWFGEVPKGLFHVSFPPPPPQGSGGLPAPPR